MTVTMSNKDLIAAGSAIMMVGDEIIFGANPQVALSLSKELDEGAGFAELDGETLFVRVSNTEDGRPFGYWKSQHDGIALEAVVYRITGLNAVVHYTACRL